MSLAAAEVDMVHQLAELIHYQSTKIFKGEGRLNVSTQTLVFLNQAMQEQYRGNFGNENDLILTLDQKRMLNTVKDDIHFVTEVLVHTTSLKLYHQSHSIPGPLDIGMFNYLTEIDINRVPVHLILGLQKLRLTLQHITINRSLCSLKSVFEKCGGDMSGPLSWQKLESANLSQNSIQELDTSLNLLPMLKFLDLSHNNLKTTGRYLENLLYVECLNLAFNHLTNLPTLSFHTKSSLTSLVLRNNSLYNLDGVEELGHLIELDVSGNLLADHSCLAVISGMHRLKKLTLFDNPMTYRTDHRTKAVGHISPLVNGNGILLDGKSLTYTELKAIQRNKITKSASFYFRPHVDSSHTICDSGISDLNCEEEQIAEPVKKKRTQCKKSCRNSRIINSERNSPIPQLSTGSDSSRTSSPQGSVTSMSIREIEQLREFHGDNWLQQYEHMRENRELSTNSPEMDNYEESDRPASPPEENSDAAAVPTEIKQESYPGFEDPFPENNNKEPSSENNNKSSPNNCETPEQKAESDDEQSDEVSILSHESSENNTESESTGLMSDEIDFDIKKMVSVENPYGEETEPFIVKRSLDEDAEEIFVSSNERFLIEKDLQGCQLDRLDMKCVTYMSILKNKGQMVVKLKFNYVKQDRRERTYVMVDKDEADELEKIIMPFLEEHQLKVNAKDISHLMCLKCSHNFTKVVEAANKTLISKGSPKKATKDSCPKCRSYNVVCQPAGSVRRDEVPQKSSVFALFSSSSNPSSGSTTPVNNASPLLRRKGVISKRRKHLTPRDMNSLTPYSDDSQSLQNWSQSAENISQICGAGSSDKARPASFNLEATQTWSETQDNIDIVNTDEDLTVPKNQESENTPILQLACEKVLKENGPSYAINMQKRKGLCLNSSPSLSLTPPDSFLTSNVCHSMVSSVYKHTLQPVGNVDGDIPKISVEEFGETIDEGDDDLEECDSRTDKESSIQPIDEPSDVSPQLTHDVTADMVSLSDSTDTNSDITALSESVDPEVHKDDIACIHLDHQIHLFLVMKHFQHAERYTFSIKSPVVQHIVGEYNGLMVMSTVNIFIFTLKGPNPSENPENFVKLKNKHSITDLKYIDIGLGYQSFRLEFDSECGSYSLLVKDEHVVRRFVSAVVEISQKFVNLGQMGPVKVGQYHHETMENVRQLLHRNDSSENAGIDVEHPEKSLTTYLMATQLKDERGEQKLPVSVAVLGTLLYLLIENHQWPMPRLQPKMPYDNIGHQFLVLDKQNILDITSLKIWKANEKRLRLTFLNEISGCEFYWDFAFENNRSVTKLIQSVKSPWEAKYKVDLEVVLVS